MNRDGINIKHIGFSLVELLIVMAILAILLGLSVPALQRGSRAFDLTAAGESIVGNIALAQQTAQTRNLQVEIRFYSVPASSGKYAFRAFQLFRVESSGLRPATKVIYFPQSTIWAEAADKTSFQNLNVQTPDASSPSLPRVGTDYKYVCFRIKPTGDTDLDPSSKWFLTLVLEKDPIKNSGFPGNFLTLQLDPVSGRSMVFRP